MAEYPGPGRTIHATARGSDVDDEKLESFDDLFEPFELDEEGQEAAEAPAEELIEDAPQVACPSCGSSNPAHNRHCEQCGARLSQGPLPVAPEPMLRTTAGARALMVLAGVILAVALVALLVNLFRGDSSDPTAATGVVDNGTTGTSLPVQAIEELQVSGVTPSSELPGFPASALIDSDPSNSWNDTQQHGGPAFLTFTFARPVQITQITVQNVTDEERFFRNYRIQDWEIEIDDLPTVTSGSLDDTLESQTITVPSVETRELTLRVISTYAAEPFEQKLPFRELAVQEVKFFGRYVDEATG